jgi:F-type H+-transporting ATPase subunit gamma
MEARSEPDAESALTSLFCQEIYFRIFQAYLHAAASEHAARMTAMDNATNNAKTLIDDTTLVRNRTRQAAITKELTEIVAGVESIRQE